MGVFAKGITVSQLTLDLSFLSDAHSVLNSVLRSKNSKAAENTQALPQEAKPAKKQSSD